MTSSDIEKVSVGMILTLSQDFFKNHPALLKPKYSTYKFAKRLKVRVIRVTMNGNSIGVSFDNPILETISTCHNTGKPNECVYVPIAHLNFIKDSERVVYPSNEEILEKIQNIYGFESATTIRTNFLDSNCRAVFKNGRVIEIDTTLNSIILRDEVGNDHEIFLEKWEVNSKRLIEGGIISKKVDGMHVKFTFENGVHSFEDSNQSNLLLLC